IKSGLLETKKLKVKELTVFSDCLPLVKHLNDDIPASKPHLEEYKKEIMDIVSTIEGKVSFSWIPKNLNGLAHNLARRSHDTPAIRRKVDGRGKSIEIFGEVAYIKKKKGCYYRVDTITFRCSCKEFIEKGTCEHSQKLKKVENWEYK
ncbi:MAG: reverse transcriptase-like protein, partial [Candidatus Hodarchaeales archaeon]